MTSTPEAATVWEGNASRQLTVAGLELDGKLLAEFAESFKRFNISVHPVEVQARQNIDGQQFHACVLPLKDATVASLQKSSWFQPRLTVLYGVGGAKEAARYVDFGINALLQSGDKSGVRAAVDATQPLLRRGIGKCARVPIATVVKTDVQGRSITGITRNVGYGGMALMLSRNVDLPEQVTLQFALPKAGTLSLVASPRWYSGRLVGLQFRPPFKEELLKRWVGEYSLLGVPAD